jgi:hypothetical protein
MHWNDSVCSDTVRIIMSIPSDTLRHRCSRHSGLLCSLTSYYFDSRNEHVYGASCRCDLTCFANAVVREQEPDKSGRATVLMLKCFKWKTLVLQHRIRYSYTAASRCVFSYYSIELGILVLQRHVVYSCTAASRCVFLYCSITLCILILQHHVVYSCTAASRCVSSYYSIALCILVLQHHVVYSGTAALHCVCLFCGITLRVPVM